MTNAPEILPLEVTPMIGLLANYALIFRQLKDPTHHSDIYAFVDTVLADENMKKVVYGCANDLIKEGLSLKWSASTVMEKLFALAVFFYFGSENTADPDPDLRSRMADFLQNPAMLEIVKSMAMPIIHWYVKGTIKTSTLHEVVQTLLPTTRQ